MEKPDQERVSLLRLAALTVLHVEGAGCAQFAALGGSRDQPLPSAWIAVGLWKGRQHQPDISIPNVPSPAHRVKWKEFNNTQAGTNGSEARRDILLLCATAEDKPRRGQS